jgi:hypothetical protein
MIPALLLAWLVVVYLPFAMRTWRQFILLCAAYLLMGIGVRLGVANFSAAEVPSALVMIGNFWIDLVVWVVPVPIIARAVVLATKSLGVRGAQLAALNVVGILALPGTWLALAGYERWDRRPAPTECTGRPIQITLADIDGSSPWSSAVSLYLGPNLQADGRYLHSPAQERRLCRETSDGTEPLAITALAINLVRPALKRCAAADRQAWEEEACAALKDRREPRLPQKLVVFDPNGIRLGEFGIPKAATPDAYPVPQGERLVTATDPELGRVSAVCRSKPFSDGSIYCQMRRPVSDAVDLYWAVAAPPGAIGESLLRAEAFASTVCAGLFKLPGCRVVPGTVP